MTSSVFGEIWRDISRNVKAGPLDETKLYIGYAYGRVDKAQTTINMRGLRRALLADPILTKMGLWHELDETEDHD